MRQVGDAKSQLDTDYILAVAHIAAPVDWNKGPDQDSHWRTMVAGTVRHPLPLRSRTFRIFNAGRKVERESRITKN